MPAYQYIYVMGEKGTLPFSPHFDLAAVRTQRSAWACSATATPTSTVRS